MSRRGSDVETSGTAARRMSPAMLGLVVFALLIALTVVEYCVFLLLDRNLPLMVLMNVADAALIMVYFMHLPRLWRTREDH